MSYILICVRITLATSDVQSISDITPTDKIHMENRNRGLDLTWTKPNNGIYNTQNRRQTA